MDSKERDVPVKMDFVESSFVSSFFFFESASSSSHVLLKLFWLGISPYEQCIHIVNHHTIIIKGFRPKPSRWTIRIVQKVLLDPVAGHNRDVLLLIAFNLIIEWIWKKDTFLETSFVRLSSPQSKIAYLTFFTYLMRTLPPCSRILLRIPESLVSTITKTKSLSVLIFDSPFSIDLSKKKWK